MAREKPRIKTLKLRPTDEDALAAVASALGIDRSSTIRFLVHEKCRALGIQLPDREAATPEEVGAKPSKAPR